jgi:tetratricopeptide (TPR) repeat protein
MALHRARYILFLFAVLAIPLYSETSTVGADSSVAAVKKIYENNAQVTDSAGSYVMRGSARLPLKQGFLLSLSDIIVTGKDTEILLEYRNKNSIYIKGNARAQLTQDTIVYQTSGEIYYRINSIFRIETDDETTQVSGTEFSVTRAGNATEIVVLEGTVLVGRKGSAVSFSITNGKKRVVKSGTVGEQTEIEISTRIYLEDQFKRIFILKDEESVTHEKLTILDDNSLVERNSTIETKKVEYTTIEISYWRNGEEKAAILKKLETDGEKYFDLNKYEDCRALAELYYSKGSFDEALNVYGRALAKAVSLEDKAAIYNNMGICRYRKGDYDAAITVLKKGISLKGDSAELHSNLAICYGAKGYDDLAKQEHDAAAKLKTSNAETLLNTGNTYFPNGNYQEAERCYRAIIAADSRFSKAYVNLALMYGDRKDYAKAWEVCQEAARNLLDDPELYLVMADTSFMQKDYSKAAAYYQKAMGSRRFDSADVHFNAGLCFELAGNEEKALEEYRKALALDPVHVSANINAGSLLQNRKDYSRALSCYERVISVDRNNAIALNNIGTIYLDADDFPKAIDYFTRVIALEPDHASSFANRGIAYIRTNQPRKAITDLQKAAQYDPSLASVSYNLAVAHENLSEYEEALAFYGKCLESGYMTDYVNFYMGNVLLKKNEPREALTHLEKALSTLGTNKELLFTLGITYGALGDTAKAVTSYEKAVSLDPGFAEAYFNLGTTYFKAGQFVDARKYYVIAAKFNPMDYDTAYNLGLTEYEMGDFAVAVAELEEARRLRQDPPPVIDKVIGESWMRLNQLEKAEQSLTAYMRREKNDAEAYFNLGVVKYKRSDLDGAAGSFRSCIALDPGFEDAYTNLGIVLRSTGKYGEAEAVARKALQAFGNKREFRMSLADVYFQTNRYKDALPILESLVAESRPESQVLFELAICYDESDMYEKALGAYHDLIESDPGFSYAYFNLGVLYYNHRDFYNCRTYLSQFMQLEKTGEYVDQARKILASLKP